MVSSMVFLFSLKKKWVLGGLRSLGAMFVLILVFEKKEIYISYGENKLLKYRNQKKLQFNSACTGKHS